MIIRNGIASDAAPIAEFWSLQIAKTSITFSSDPKRAGDVAQMIAQRPCFLVAELEEQTVGFITYDNFRDGTGYKHTKELTIILAPVAQRQGAGRALLKAAIERARAQDVHVLVAGVSGENTNAIAFHKRMGFEQAGVMPQVGRKFGRWMDLVLLQKML